MFEFLVQATTLNWHGFALFTFPIIGTALIIIAGTKLYDDLSFNTWAGILAACNAMLWHSVYMAVRLIF